jgi:hypothetical protein
MSFACHHQYHCLSSSSCCLQSELPQQAFHLLAEVGTTVPLLQHSIRNMKLYLQMFHLLAVNGATTIFQPSLHVSELPLEAFHLLIVTTAGIRAIQHFWPILIHLDFCDSLS